MTVDMDKVIDHLFKRLAGAYGDAWDRFVANVPIADVRTVWAHELSAFKDSLGRIAWALDNLPERFPNVIVFKRLCQAAPAQAGYEEVPAIEYSTPIDPEVQKVLINALRKPGSSDMKAWAKTLKSRMDAGEKLNTNQIRCTNNALRLNENEEQR